MKGKPGQRRSSGKRRIKKDFGKMGCSQIKKIVDAAQTPEALLKKGLNARRLQAMGFSPECLRTKRLPLGGSTLEKPGFRAKPLNQLNFSLNQLMSLGVTLRGLWRVFSADGLRSLKPEGYERFRAQGFSERFLENLKKAKPKMDDPALPGALLKSAGVRANALRANGFSALELREVGYTAEELSKAGYSAAEIRKAGFSQQEIAKARKKS